MAVAQEGTLYTYSDNFRAAKALITAAYSKAKVNIEPNFVLGETNKTKEFLKKFPTGKVPAFETKTGDYLQDSNAIAYFLSNEQLRGKTHLEQAQVLQWVGFAESDILPSACAWVFPVLGILKPTSSTLEAYHRAKDDLKRSLHVLNTHLLANTFLATERITLADIVVFCNLYYAYKFVLDPEYRKPFANVNRWFLTLANQSQFKGVLGEIVLCEKPAQALGEQVPPAADGKKKKEEKKEKKQPPKKEQPKKEAEPVEELDAAEAILAAEPKAKDPFDALPKGTFNMDDFKRFYSNEDEAKSIPYFWEKFDPENYSIWYGEYKYGDELTRVFMSCNLITGMFQRLEKMRKCAFGSVCLWGEDNNSSISGVWVWRGQDLAFTLSPDWSVDYETYDWKKLDPASPETKQLVEQYFSWTGTDKAGRKFNQGKIFK